MSDNLISENPLEESPKRSQFLTTLCILSYIWNGMALLFLLLCLLFSGLVYEALGKINSGDSPFTTMDESQQKAIQMILDYGRGFVTSMIALAMIIYMTSLLGVVKMWKLQKWGFYIYATLNSFGVMYSFLSGSYFMGIISLSFITMYYLNLKDMK